MATGINPAVSLYEYLHTSYRPDCDYVDGVIEERSLGELDHGEVQYMLAQAINHLGRNWNVKAVPELRIQVSPTRYRIADLCVISRSAPREQIVQTPPVAVIEILSPEDRISRYNERLADYRRMGIQNIWVIDPARRKAFDCSTGSWMEAERLAPAACEPAIEIARLFAAIDEQ